MRADTPLACKISEKTLLSGGSGSSNSSRLFNFAKESFSPMKAPKELSTCEMNTDKILMLDKVNQFTT